MPGTRPHFDDFADMPDGLRNFLFSDAYDEAEADLTKAYNLMGDEASAVSDALLDAAFADATLPETVASIKSKLVPRRITEDKWKTFLSDLLKKQVWPLRDLYGAELTDVLSKEGLTTAGWPIPRVLLKPLSFSGAASAVAEMSGFSLVGQMRDRLKDLILSKSKGIRTDDQVKEMMTRSSEMAGLGLDSATAEKTVANINQLLSSIKILSDAEYEAWLEEESRRNAPPPPPALVVTSTSDSTEDDEEIAAIKAKMPVETKPATVLDQAVEQIFNSITARPEDDYLAKRLRYIISSRLRDVRSLIELKQLLQRDTKVGGVGLARDVADGIATQIETGYATFHGQIMDEEKKNLETQITEQKLKIEDRKKREADEHAKWYQEKVLARKQEDTQRTKFAEEVKRTMVVGPTTVAHPIDAKEARTETAKFGAMVPAVASGAAAMASPSVGRPMSAMEKAPPPQTVSSPFTPAAPRVEAHPSVKISTTTVDLQRAAPTIRPRVDDVVSPASAPAASPTAMRLMGPIGELQGITLSDFRRLSKNPEEAATKILQKFEVLSQESFERRNEGIKAWMASPLQGSYMKLVSEALATGKPVIKLAEDGIAAGRSDIPSPDEISAILNMNAKLHF
jgi:hypothetical protein